MARRIVITSGKGGAGKTTVCANLGIALAKRSLRVLLVDLDLGLNNLDVVMQVENKVVYDFVDVCEGRCRPSQALIQDENEPTLYIMPSCHSAKRQITVDMANKVIDKIADNFRFSPCRKLCLRGGCRSNAAPFRRKGRKQNNKSTAGHGGLRGGQPCAWRPCGVGGNAFRF